MRGALDAERISRKSGGDPAILGILVLLAGTGLAALWSASAGYSLSLGKGSDYFFKRQLVFLVPALFIFTVCASIKLESLRRRMGLITLGCLALLVLPFFPGVGESRNGAARWIDLGFTTLQPSELWKIAVLLYLAHVLDRRADRVEEGSGALLPPFLLAALGCLIVYLQNDFSTAVVTGLAVTVMFWIAGAQLSFFLGLGAAMAPLAALSILTSDFRLRRILAFMFPAYEPHGQGYQVLGSLRAIRSGGFFGKGIGLGTMKISSVPEVQSDFVLAAWAEETGFAGLVFLFALWALLAWKVYRSCFEEEEPFRSWLGFGLMSLLCVEVLVNAAVVAGAVPATGIALPFFSAGGTSLISNFAVCGLLYNLSRGGQERAARSESRAMDINERVARMERGSFLGSAPRRAPAEVGRV